MSPKAVLIGAGVLGSIIGAGSIATPQLQQAVAEAAAERTAVENSVTYSGCRQAQQAGATPLYRGDPGYRPTMDGDNDGIACEDY